jgi:hypothetical protein
MRTFTISMRYLALLFVTACGDTAGARPDAGSVPDAGAVPDASVDSCVSLPDAAPIEMPGALKRLDWRATRGAPIATSAVTIPAAGMFAVSEDGFVTQSECQSFQDFPDLPAQSCTFTWHDLAGTPGMRRDRMAGVTSTVVSPDGRRALLVALDELETCTASQLAFPVARGALQLLDLATGAASFEDQLRSNFSSALGFTPLSDWFSAAPISGTECIASTTGLLSTTSPFAPPPGLDATDELVQVVDARRWVVIRSGADLGLADPLTPGSFRSFGDDPSPFFDATQGWVHVYLGFSNLAQDVVSIPPTGPMRQTALHDADWFPSGALGRWIRVCGLTKFLEGYRDCRVVDAQAEVAPANFRATMASDHPDDAVLLGSGAVVFVGPTADGSRAVQRIVLATGQREILHPGNGTLRSLGDGAAALLVQDGAAWLIEAQREELVAEHVSRVVGMPRRPPMGRLPGRQDDVALLTLSSGTGQITLAILDVRTRRLATVTDNLYFTPPPGGSPFVFNANDGCGQPWTTRNGGTLLDGLFQQPQHLFFVEQGTPATLWLLPIDLSAPPRRLAKLAGDPASCHAPLSSPDGRRVGFAEDGAGGTTTQITLSSKNCARL